MKKTIHNYLYPITITYFLLGMINIHFALLGFICMFTPFYLLFRDTKKTWCQQYCPRSSLFTKLFKKSPFAHATPKFMARGNGKWFMLIYFIYSLSLIALSTIKVANGANPNTAIVLFTFIKIPFALPQLFSFVTIPWVYHLAYRLYSMMITMTILGSVLGLFFRPRTWCTICPISTVSGVYVKYRQDHAHSKA